MNSWINQKYTIKKKGGGHSNSLAQLLNDIKYETDTVKEKKYFTIPLIGGKNQINKLMNLDLKNTFKSIFKWEKKMYKKKRNTYCNIKQNQNKSCKRIAKLPHLQITYTSASLLLLYLVWSSISVKCKKSWNAQSKFPQRYFCGILFKMWCFILLNNGIAFKHLKQLNIETTFKYVFKF